VKPVALPPGRAACIYRDLAARLLQSSMRSSCEPSLR